MFDFVILWTPLISYLLLALSIQKQPLHYDSSYKKALWSHQSKILERSNCLIFSLMYSINFHCSLFSLSLSLSRNHPLFFLSTFHLVYWILWSFILNVKAIAKKFRSFRCGNIKTKNVKRLYSPLKMNEYPHKYINLYNQIFKIINLNTSTQKYKLCD